MAGARAPALRAPAAGWRWWHGMLAGMLLMLSPGAAVLLTVLAAPVLLVLVADTTPGRAVTRTVMLFCIAGALVPLRSFLSMGHDMATAAELLATPGTLLLPWSAAGCGWLLDEACGLTATLISRRRSTSRQRSLEAELLALRAEWGDQT